MDAGPVICAFEASADARRAVDAAAWLAGELHAPLELIHVFDPGAQPALPRDGAFVDPVLRETAHRRADERTRARMEWILQSVVASLAIEDVTTRLLDGPVVPTVHEAAADRGARFLVCGTAARAGVQHVLQGSVAGALAATAPCPVVTVPPEAEVAEPGQCSSGTTAPTTPAARCATPRRSPTGSSET